MNSSKEFEEELICLLIKHRLGPGTGGIAAIVELHHKATQARVRDSHELLKEASKVLREYWFTTVQDGEYEEDFNNDDVISLNKRIDAYLSKLGEQE